MQGADKMKTGPADRGGADCKKQKSGPSGQQARQIDMGPVIELVEIVIRFIHLPEGVTVAVGNSVFPINIRHIYILTYIR